MKHLLKSFILGAIVIPMGQFAHSQAPVPLIPFQGHLTQPRAGSPGEYEPVSDGEYDILFAIYASPVGGETLVWGPERHEDVVVVNGLVNVLLGSVESFDDELSSNPNFFNRSLYVGITIDADGNPNTTDLELVPRQVLLPAIQAINSDELDGRDWRDFFDGTDEVGTFTPGMTKARDANLFDGIDSAAVFVDPSDTVNPKVKVAALAEGIAGSLNIDGNLTVQGNLEVMGDIIGIVQQAIGETGFLRIDDIQICWGAYISEVTDDGAFEPTFDAIPTNLPAPYLDEEYIVIASAAAELPGDPLTNPAAYNATVYERTPSSFKALTHRIGPGSETSDRPGWFITIGRWRPEIIIDKANDE